MSINFKRPKPKFYAGEVANISCEGEQHQMIEQVWQTFSAKLITVCKHYLVTNRIERTKMLMSDNEIELKRVMILTAWQKNVSQLMTAKCKMMMNYFTRMHHTKCLSAILPIYSIYYERRNSVTFS